MDPYATHQRLLIAAAMQTEGPIVEMGCGDYSTPLLAEIAAVQSRSFTVYTTSKEWGDKYSSALDVRILLSWDAYPYPRCGLTLLDNEEYVRDRKRHIPRLLGTSDVIICHDIGADEWGAAYVTAFTQYSPPSVALSQRKKVVLHSQRTPTIVACVYKMGGEFTAEYVSRLLKGVLDHTTLPLRFVCFTDSDEDLPCQKIPLTDNLPGWWSKLELFKKFWGRVVYFDLDTIITGNIDPLLEYDGPMALLKDLWAPNNKLSTGVMVWNSPMQFLVPEEQEKAKIISNPKAMDEFHIVGKLKQMQWHVDIVQDIVKVASYKWECQEKGVPEGTNVVCFHGKPRPHDVGWSI
jgi:hypothetical protein